MRRCRWILAAFAIVLFRLNAVAADTPVTYVRTLAGDEWAPSFLGYHAAALVISANGRSCTLSVEQIDWEASAQRNGGPIDLLRLPEVEGAPAACETPSTPPPFLDLDSVRPDVVGAIHSHTNGSLVPS